MTVISQQGRARRGQSASSQPRSHYFIACAAAPARPVHTYETIEQHKQRTALTSVSYPQERPLSAMKLHYSSKYSRVTLKTIGASRRQADEVGHRHQHPFSVSGEIPDEGHLHVRETQRRQHPKAPVDHEAVLAEEILPAPLAVVRPAQDGREGEDRQRDGDDVAPARRWCSESPPR